jgi:hypothetical protein
MKGTEHVFVSHSSRDNEVGGLITAVLERAGIRCWFSARASDLEPGVEWDDNIVSALDRSTAVLLLFSSAANNSRWVKRELAMASARGLTVYPVRLEDVSPTGAMEAYLVSVQWTDVFDGPLEERLSPILRKLGAPQSEQQQVRMRPNYSKLLPTAGQAAGLIAALTLITAALVGGFRAMEAYLTGLRRQPADLIKLSLRDVSASDTWVTSDDGTFLPLWIKYVLTKDGQPALDCRGEFDVDAGVPWFHYKSTFITLSQGSWSKELSNRALFPVGLPKRNMRFRLQCPGAVTEWAAVEWPPGVFEKLPKASQP